ncbi:MAG: aminotransferase class I and II [Desulfuromonas sp.]|nr:MAG: aminotransferase class I and II [Desulfuromonas sp.]
MNFAISDNIQQIHFPPISEVKNWLTGRTFPASKPLVDLCQAIPDYTPPQGLLSELSNRLSDPLVCKYSPDEGLADTRKAVCDWYERRYQKGPQPAELCLTIGASQAFWLAMTVLCQAGDEVILQLPAYFDHPMGLQAMGVTPVYAPYNPQNNGLPDPAQIAELITPRTRAILLVTPSNPTGATIPAQQLEELWQLASAHNIALVLDETYNAFIDTQPHQLFAKKDWDDTLIHIASFGKTFALTGFRAGALVASERFIHQALKAQDGMVVCQPRITQYAIAYGCQNLDQWVADNAQAMRRRHDLFCNAFFTMDTPFSLEASGAFFAWIKHPWPHLTGRQAAKRLLDEAHISCLPGEVFGPRLDPYLRLAFGNIREDEIAGAVARFSQFNSKGQR